LFESKELKQQREAYCAGTNLLFLLLQRETYRVIWMMCIAFFVYRTPHQFWIASNRDEFWSRPSASMEYWAPNNNDNIKDLSPILAGRDLEQGGTWLALRRDNNNNDKGNCSSRL
jgi:hypothetical protein